MFLRKLTWPGLIGLGGPIRILSLAEIRPDQYAPLIRRIFHWYKVLRLSVSIYNNMRIYICEIKASNVCIVISKVVENEIILGCLPLVKRHNPSSYPSGFALSSSIPFLCLSFFLSLICVMFNFLCRHY